MSENIVIEPATEADLDELSEMLGGLFAQESDFRPDKDKQLRGLRLIFEQPSRGRVFVLRRDGAIVAMINLLFTISTAEGGFVILLEDLVVHTEYQGKGYGSKLLKHAIDFAKQKNFLRITLLTDRPENVAQEFFRRHGFVESSMIPMRLWLNPQNIVICDPRPALIPTRSLALTPRITTGSSAVFPLDPGVQLRSETSFELGPKLNFINRLCHFRRASFRQICLRVRF